MSGDAAGIGAEPLDIRPVLQTLIEHDGTVGLSRQRFERLPVAGRRRLLDVIESDRSQLPDRRFRLPDRPRTVRIDREANRFAEAVAQPSEAGIIMLER